MNTPMTQYPAPQTSVPQQNNEDHELGFEDEISKEAPEYVLIPDGDYQFTVKMFERGRFNGSEKMPACNMVKVTISVRLPDGNIQDMTNNFLLHTKIEGILTSFFECIGLKKKGDPLHMNWPGSVGRSGIVRIGHQLYNGNTYNRIKNWVYTEPQAANQVQPQASVQPQSSYKPGNF